MLGLWHLKKKQQQEEAGKKHQSITSAELRMKKDVSELQLPPTMKAVFPDLENILNFKLTIQPDEGMYKDGLFTFNVVTGLQYPHEAPKVKCTQVIYHPNIDLQGNVCLNILREDWNPVLNLNSIVVGLQYLFLEPNPDDPLNKEAAQELLRDRDLFIRNVKNTMRGAKFKDVQYDNVLASAQTTTSNRFEAQATAAAA